MQIKSILVTHDEKVATIHALRVKCREILSLIEKTDPYYPSLKKVIKISNKIRDIDVFFDFFIPSLPKKLKKQLINCVEKNITCKRVASFEKLYIYLLILEIPEKLETNREKKMLQSEKTDLLFEKEALHRYRIYIKSLLYTYKNSLQKDKKKIKTLSHVKDLLGYINDNFNAMQRLESMQIPSKLFLQINTYVDLENQRYYQEVQTLSKQIC